jgi:pyrroline-5-carboxylate reductase
MAKKETLGILGLGRIGKCLALGAMESDAFDPKNLFFTTAHEESAKAAQKELGCSLCKSNEELIEKSDLIVIAVKPQSVAGVLKALPKKILSDKTFVSVAASVSTKELEALLPSGSAVLRAMPNTPVFVKAGITALCRGTAVQERDWMRCERLFSPLGELVEADEKSMDAITGLSGCGPAYIFLILEALTEAGIKVGLPRDLASKLAVQTVLGSAQMLKQTGKHPAALRDEVTTPAGCTIEGLMELEEGKVRVALIKAVVQATKRAKELSQNRS